MALHITNTMYTLPYLPDRKMPCNNVTTEYYYETVNRCCSKCRPGTHLKTKCSTDFDTVCEPCAQGLYSSSFNFHKNCNRCPTCLQDQGLEYVQKCTRSSKTLCKCQPGKYCKVGEPPDCEECGTYTSCKPGFGVFIKGTEISDVKCRQCHPGTFSDILSNTQACQNHKDCKSQGRSVLTNGNETSDTVCGPNVNGSLAFNTSPRLPSTNPPSGTQQTTPSLEMLGTSTLPTKQESMLTNYSSDTPVIAPTEIKELSFAPWIGLSIVVGSIVGVLLLVCIMKVVTRCRRASSTDDMKEHSEKIIKFGIDGPLVIQNSTFKNTCPEKQLLLGMGDGIQASQAQYQEVTRLGSGYFNSQEVLSVGSLQSNLPQLSTLQQPSTPASTPQTSSLQSGLQHASTPASTMPSNLSQPSTPTSTPLSSLQPTSSLPSSPLVNVNITVNYPVGMGNGHCGTPTSSTPIEFSQADAEAPLSKEEELLNMPFQEGGKEAFMAVQESG